MYWWEYTTVAPKYTPTSSVLCKDEWYEFQTMPLINWCRTRLCPQPTAIQCVCFRYSWFLWCTSPCHREFFDNKFAAFCWWPGGWINIKMPSYQYTKSHCGDKTILRPSYLHDGISYTVKMASLFWIGALFCCQTCWCYTTLPRKTWELLSPVGSNH